MIHITSDSTTDLGELYERRGIEKLPLAVVLGSETYEDGVTIHPSDIYDFVEKNKILPKTAARSVEEHREFFASILKSDDDSIVHFTISSKLSVTYQNALTASKDFKNVYVVDSQSLSSGGGLLTLYACDLRDEGKYTAKEIYEKCLARVPAVEASFFVDTMDYLYKGGRCSGLASFFATALKLKPSLILVDGKIAVGKKYRGNPVAFATKYVDNISRCSPTPTPRAFSLLTPPPIPKSYRKSARKSTNTSSSAKLSKPLRPARLQAIAARVRSAYFILTTDKQLPQASKPARKRGRT